MADNRHFWSGVSVVLDQRLLFSFHGHIQILLLPVGSMMVGRYVK